VTSTTARIVLASLGIFVDYIMKYAVGAVVIWNRREARRVREGDAEEAGTQGLGDGSEARPKGLKGAYIGVYIPGASRARLRSVVAKWPSGFALY
jgi:hypothetical protein